MKVVSVLEAKNQLSRLLRSVRAGSDVIISNRGEPVARLTAIDAAFASGAVRGTAAAILEYVLAPRAAARHGRTAHDIDRAIATERKAWD